MAQQESLSLSAIGQIAMGVKDLDGAYERLRADNVQLEGEPHKIAELEDHDLWMAFFRDSEANLLALMEERPRG